MKQRRYSIRWEVTAWKRGDTRHASLHLSPALFVGFTSLTEGAGTFRFGIKFLVLHLSFFFQYANGSAPAAMRVEKRKRIS